jgi:hypothetical protein
MSVVDCCVVSPRSTRNNCLWPSGRVLGGGQGPDMPGHAGLACRQYGLERSCPWRWGFEVPGGTKRS